MPTSPRMGWPYPAEYQDPFFESFQAMVAAQDASMYATREDRNVLLMAGGTVAFTASSGLLSWTAPLELNSAVTGFKWTVAAGSVTLLDGQYLFLSLARNPITNTLLLAQSASILPRNDPDNTLVLGLRNGNRIYFRDGRVLIDGDSVPLFSAPPSANGGVGVSGEQWRENIALASSASTNVTTPKVLGSYSLNPSEYTLNRTVKNFEFCVVANVDDSSVHGVVKLYNLTLGADAAAVTFTGNTTTLKQVAVATLPLSENLYEVRAYLTAGTGTMYVQWAGMRINNVIV